jgi:hypothetical protein
VASGRVSFAPGAGHEEPARRLFLDEQCADALELRGEVDRWHAADGQAPAHLAVAVGAAVRPFHTTLEPGARIDPYEIAGLEGEGGIGSPYLVCAYTIATAHAGAGNRASALEWLDESYRRREETMAFVAVDPMLDVVRSEPLFDALLEKMDLPRN